MKNKKYNLSQFDDVQQDFLFWIEDFIDSKLLSSSKDNIKDENFSGAEHSKKIKKCTNIEDLKTHTKKLKNLGLDLSNYTNPMYAFYDFIIKDMLESFYQITISYIDDNFTNDYMKEFKNEKGNKLGESSIKKYRSTVVSFFKHIEENNVDGKTNIPYKFYLSVDKRGDRVPTPFSNTYKKVPVYLIESEYKQFNKEFIKHISSNDDDKKRDILIVKILLFSGISNKELLELKENDFKVISSSNSIDMHIRGKGKKNRVLNLPKSQMIRFYNQYVELREDNEYFFYSSKTKDNKLGSSHALDLTKDLMNKININKNKISIDIYKNTFAIHLKNKRMPDAVIAELLGYSKLSTLKELVSFDDEELVKSCDAFMDFV